MHFRKLKASKKRLLQEGVAEVLNKYGGKKLFVWYIEIEARKMSRKLEKLKWLRSRIEKIIGGFMRTATIVRIVIGSDLEFRNFSLYESLKNAFGEDIVQRSDTDKEIQIADATANYIRLNRPSYDFVFYEEHHC